MPHASMDPTHCIHCFEDRQNAHCLLGMLAAVLWSTLHEQSQLGTMYLEVGDREHGEQPLLERQEGGTGKMALPSPDWDRHSCHDKSLFL